MSKLTVIFSGKKGSGKSSAGKFVIAEYLMEDKAKEDEARGVISKIKNLLPTRRRNLLSLGFIIGFFAGGISIVTFVSTYLILRKLQSRRAG